VTRARGGIAILIIAIALSVSLAAQWPSFPSQNVPRTADGKPDLRAKAPRTADGKPDFSGIWENPGWRNLGTGVSGTGGAPGTPAVLPRGPGLFFDIASGVPGGLPLTPYGAGIKKARLANNSADNPDAHCLPLGNIQLHTHPMPRKIVQTPKVMLLLYEGNAGIRQILIDGRSLPPRDAQPWWYGYTTASWDGDALVARTSGFRDDGWLDVNGSPLTDAATVTERFTRPDFGHMSIDITIDDPKAYTKPWSVTVNHDIMLDTDLIEFVCAENEKSSAHFR
jgi:hypothetical protein